MTRRTDRAVIRLSLSGLVILSLVAPASGQMLTGRDSIVDLQREYGSFSGAFVAFDTRTGVTIRHNPELCRMQFSPASTFKIPNSLIGLETAVIPDEHFVIPWDSVPRGTEAWNRDHNLATAIAHSVVWYYQELARRVGRERMQRWVDSLSYGNKNISGGIDHFWLGSSLRISPEEEVQFLRRLVDGTLPSSERSMAIVKKILVQERNEKWVLCGKTGFATFAGDSAAGWFVGWVERSDTRVVFASCIITGKAQKEADEVFQSRKPIALAILRSLGIIAAESSRRSR